MADQRKTEEERQQLLEHLWKEIVAIGKPYHEDCDIIGMKDGGWKAQKPSFSQWLSICSKAAKISALGADEAPSPATSPTLTAEKASPENNFSPDGTSDTYCKFCSRDTDECILNPCEQSARCVEPISSLIGAEINHLQREFESLGTVTNTTAEKLLRPSFDRVAERVLQMWPNKLGMHLQHCNFGEQVGVCKYGEDDCPALTEKWSWFGKAIQRTEIPESSLEILRILASAMRKVLPSELLQQMLEHIDPLGVFMKALREEGESNGA